MKICVVALGKIGLPLAVQFATKGHEVIGADISGSVVGLVNDGAVPVPRRDRPGRAAEGDRGGGPADRDDGHISRGRGLRGGGRGRAALRRRGRDARLQLDGQRDAFDRGGATTGHTRELRDDPAGGDDARPLGADAGRGIGAERRARLLRRVQSGAGVHGSRLRRPAALSEARRRNRRGVGPARRRVLRGGARLRPARRPGPAQWRVGSRLRRGGRDWRSWPRRRTAT